MKPAHTLIATWTIMTACPSAPAATPTPKVGREIAISPGEEFAHVETMLVVNPKNPRHLMASCIALPKNSRGAFTFRARTYVSLDEGENWRVSILPEKTQWDPIVAFTPNGTPLLACLINDRIKVFQSPDTGLTWHSPVTLPEGDHPMMAVDCSSGVHRGSLYLAACNDAGDILVHRSTNEAVTFTTTIAQNGLKGGFVDHLAILANGTLFLPLRSRVENGTETLSSCTSTNGGRTFSNPIPIARRSYTGKGHSGNNAPAYAAGMYGGTPRIFCVLGRCRGDLNSRLNILHSDDYGRTWSQPHEIVEHVPADVTHGQANVMINASGIVGVSFLERHISPSPQPRFKEGEEVVFDFNETYDLLFTTSTDGGRTFLPPVRISTVSSKPKSRHASRFMPGTDYMLASPSPNGAFHLLWPDARSGIFQLYTRTVQLE